MFTKVKIVLSLGMLVISGFSLAQQKTEFKPDQYRAIHWTMQDRLPNNQSNVMFKDAGGFLWIGSGSGGGGELCRFDGTVFKKYFPEKNKRGAINTGNITGFLEDSLNNIWIATEKGLSWYDSKADTFNNFSPFIKSVSSSFKIAPFWATKDEVFCLEPGAVITAFNIHTLVRKILVQLSMKDAPQADRWNANKSFFEKSSNSIWTLQDGIYGKLQQIFLDGRPPQYYTWPCYDKTKHKHVPEFRPRHGAEDMEYDPKRNSVWINSGEGLLRFSLTDKQFYRTDALNKLTNLKDYDRGVGIDIDKDGRVWLSTFTMGIFIYDPETDLAQPFFSDTDPHQEAGKYNLHIYCDRDGIVWTSNWSGKGIYELVPYNPPIKQYSANPKFQDSLSSGEIISIIPGPHGQMWLGTTDGLNIFDPTSEKFKVLREKDLPGIVGNVIVPLHIDTLKQKAWLAVSVSPDKYFEMDMYELDMKTRKCRPIIFRDGTKQFTESYAEPYLVAPYKNSLLVWNDTHKLGLFEIKENSQFADLVFPSKMGVSGWVLKDDLIFLRKWEKEFNTTLENKNGTWTQVPHLLDSLNWQFMNFNDKDQTLWIGFSSELIQYNKDFSIIKRYTGEDGYHGSVSKFLADKNGNIWFANLAKEIGRPDPATGTIITLTAEDGYQKQDFQWNACGAKDAWDNLYFGIGYQGQGKGGLNRIYPESNSFAGTASVYLRSLSVTQKSFPPFTVANNLEELDLQYYQNTLKIETRNIDFYSKGKGQLRYKLERNGKNDDWQYGQANQPILYVGLPPGSYRLVMQASVFGKDFNGPEKILIINISPAFWETWWFWTITIISLVTLFYTLIRWRMKQKFLKQLEKSEKERQVAELKQKATELEMQALRAQMNPHFIFNSLNSINRFILQNERLQASEYLTKFSKLVRMILQNSQASVISLESELEALGLYLEMEALRFNYHFNYKISVPKEMDVEELKVPPLIIQPYVENAIWHGLMHKEEKGQLDIEVSQEDDHLYFKVVDNGIGRKRAAELSSKSATKHKSMGLKITAHRIAMMQNSNGLESPVKINDLVNADGTAAGTEVVIKMPVLYD
jgi:streptogramin lyase